MTNLRIYELALAQLNTDWYLENDVDKKEILWNELVELQALVWHEQDMMKKRSVENG